MMSESLQNLIFCLITGTTVRNMSGYGWDIWDHEPGVRYFTTLFIQSGLDILKFPGERQLAKRAIPPNIYD